jgi:thioredoxin 1
MNAMNATDGTNYAQSDLSRADVDALAGATVLDFGTSWCGVCRATRPVIADAFAAHAGVRQLWPTLIFLRDGREVARLVRPRDAQSIGRALAAIAPA